MSAAWTIAREEWRLLLRDRVAVLGMALWLLLSAAAAFTAWDQRSAAQAQRERHQSQVDSEFEAQPDRHPHRMVHYGHFVFRPLNPLAAFDAGIDAYTGHTLFLEGHRQNSANFGDVRQSSLLLRFGQLTPAFVLQVLAPLLLIFMGHACIAREREAGTLRVLLAQGVGTRQFL
ncbi:ABC transporter permease subunit, partial [Bacillus cereus group sp. BY17LC]